MANYYFLITALPPLTLGTKPEMSFHEVKEMLQLNLSKSDYHQFKQLLIPIDLYNIRALWLGLPLDEKGNYKAKDLEEELLVQGALPQYLIDYLERYESTEERLRYFSSLFVSLYRELPKLQGFLLRYFQFERELRLVLTALRAKKRGRDLVKELQFEDVADPFVAAILAQKDSPDYMPPREFEDLKVLFMDNENAPQKLQRALLQFRFDQIAQMEENQDFSIDRVLAYVARLLLVEGWAQLDYEQGKSVVQQLSQYG